MDHPVCSVTGCNRSPSHNISRSTAASNMKNLDPSVNGALFLSNELYENPYLDLLINNGNDNSPQKYLTDSTMRYRVFSRPGC